jgi:hypothetical protein
MPQRTRSATVETEYTAFYVRHLPLKRHAPCAIPRWASNRIVIPLLREYQL